jgi:alpha-amylase/alpha-mannosidase (GH57 family)
MTFEALIKNHSAEVIEKTITEALSKEFVDIQFDFFEQDQWAVVTTHQYEEDREISIRLHLNDYWDLVFGYYDDDEEFIEIVHPLTEAEKKILPERLIKVMKKVLEDEKGMRIPNKLLFK